MAKKPQTTDAAPAPEPKEYTVVARRYRPQQFSDLVGQESVAKALVNAIQSGRVAHAYLFTGVRGVGKTSAARILAKALNCVTGPTATPCDQCDACLAIASGEDIDVQEIDGASNRGIDEARAIRQNVSTRPSRSRYKIYIIDEVHMLTGPAFNALLKTLEEPPPHVKFIFATTEVQKIPITILSRCQRFDFGGITINRIMDRLREVISGEHLTADDEALRIIARRAGGSMRDAQSLLEQLLSFGGDTLTADMVHTMLGTAPDDRVVEIASAVLSKDATTGLRLVGQCVDEGLQLGELLDQMIDYWRSLMLLSCSQGAWSDFNLAEHHHATIKQQANAATLDTILAGLDVLATTKSRLRQTGQGPILMEMAIVRLSRLDELIPIAQLSLWLSQGGAQGGAAGNVIVKAGPAPTVDPAKKNALSSAITSTTPPPKPRPSPLSDTPNLGPQTTPISEANLSEVWDRVKVEAGAMHAFELAKAGSPAILGPKALALRFPKSYNHAYDYCRDPSRVQVVEKALQRVTGQEWSLRMELDATSVVPTTPTEPVLSNRERERRTLENPLLGRIIAKLEGRLLRMDEGFGTGDDEPDDRAANTDAPADEEP